MIIMIYRLTLSMMLACLLLAAIHVLVPAKQFPRRNISEPKKHSRRHHRQPVGEHGHGNDDEKSSFYGAPGWPSWSHIVATCADVARGLTSILDVPKALRNQTPLLAALPHLASSLPSLL